MALTATIDVRRIHADLGLVGSHNPLVVIGVTNVAGVADVTCSMVTSVSGDTGTGGGGAVSLGMTWTDADFMSPVTPEVGTYGARIVAPRLLELRRVNTKQKGGRVDSWDFVDDAAGTVILPTPNSFVVQDDSENAYAVGRVGFRRRVLAGDIHQYAIRIDNSLYLELTTDIAEGVTVSVTNPNEMYLPRGTTWKAENSRNRYGAAIHVNQEGYCSSLPKKAMIGFWAGTLGEVGLTVGIPFKIVSATDDTVVFSGATTSRAEPAVWNYVPPIYSQVLQADFSALTKPGAYYLQVPGFGSSVMFKIDPGIPLGFLRTYALGLYHQRCGSSGCALPYTRHTHGPCHTKQALVPLPAENFAFTWRVLEDYGVQWKPAEQTAPAISRSTMLFPYVQSGPIEVSGGHHDAGDYSRYITNCAMLMHYLVFTVDAIPGAKDLDNLGLPESGDGKSDILAEAKYEADFIAKMQDTDGGFYFLVYPREYEYELGFTPDASNTDLVVWPKTAHSTAAAVAALAQISSSPTFRAQYGSEIADSYLAKAKAGYTFLKDAIATHGGIDAIYQAITHYGAFAMARDELAWAACEMYIASYSREDFTAEEKATYHTDLQTWFPNPLDTSEWTALNTWDYIFGGWGNACRSYVFGARSGKVPAQALNEAYRTVMERALIKLADDETSWYKQNAYGVSFPYESKRFRVAGWFFGLDRVPDIAVANVLSPKADYVEAIVGNMNYEAGCNPVNQSYLTGVGRRRQQTIVHQWADADDRKIPPEGIPIGCVNAGFPWLWPYDGEMGALSFPRDYTDPPYPMYDRWSDSWILQQEFVAPVQARAILALSALLPYVASKGEPWKSGVLTIVAPTTVVLGKKRYFYVESPVDLSSARIMWEVDGCAPEFGTVFTFVGTQPGSRRIEVEAHLPDGRRLYARTWVNVIDSEFVIEGGANVVCRLATKHTVESVTVAGVAYISAERDMRLLDCSISGGASITAGVTYQENIENWVNGDVMAGSYPIGEGGDASPWATGTDNPAPLPGTTAWHESSSQPAGVLHRHGCGEGAPHAVSDTDTLFAWVYLDPANLPSTIMFQWFGSFGLERALWGIDQYPVASWGEKYLGGAIPPAGRWYRMEMPVSGLNINSGETVNGVEFLMIGGHAWWGTAGVIKGRT